jgi:hypothetical protein
MSKARELAELGAVYDSGALSNRNIIINGAFQVAQRGTSSTTNGYQTVDRWGASLGDGTSTKAQSTDAPSGFANSFSITMSTAAGSIAGYNYVHHYIEGNLIDQFAFETSDAKNITLSFYVKSSITGTWGGAIRNYVVSPATSYRSQSFTYTINAANTWERKTVTIAGDTGGSGQWNTGSLGSMSLFFDMGSVALTQATGSWLGNNCVGATGTQTSFITTTNATWQITGVQLEVGSEATPFEHRSYGDELARCQRYFQKYNYSNDLSDGTAANTLPVNCCYTTTIAYGGSKLTQEMRTSPTFSASAAGTWVFYTASSSYTSADLAAYETGPFMWGMKYETSGSWTAGNAVYGRPTGTSSYYQFDAEL